MFKGVKTDPTKVEARRKMPTPESVTKLRRFLETANYLAMYLPQLSSMLPLHHLLRKDVPVHWTEAQNEAFLRLKEKNVALRFLPLNDPKKSLVLENDAYECGLGAVLMQEGRPIAYVGRLEKFHHYTYGGEVKVVTEYRPLVVAMKRLSKALRRS